MTTLHLTERALADIDALERFSAEAWGPQLTAQYFADPSAALSRLEENPGLLVERQEYSGRLRFYGVRKHVLVCVKIADRIYVLTVWHGAMDLLGRLERLEPQLRQESELFAHRIEQEKP